MQPTWAKRCLTVIGLIFCAISILQATLAFGDASWISFFGAPQWALTVFREGGIKLALLAALAISGSLAIASYCFSGAGLIRPLPGQTAILFALGTVLLVWGLRVFQLIVIQFSGTGPVRWQLFFIRGTPLLIGILIIAAVSALSKNAGGMPPTDKQ